MNETNPTTAPRDRGLIVLRVLVAWALLSVVLMSQLRVGGSDVVRLEIAGSAQNFETELKRWQEPGEALCGVGAKDDGRGPGFGTLRCNLFVDSVGLVPGYVGLLLLFTLTLAPRAGWRHALAPHLLCAPAVAAGLFDIAENGMTGRALEDWQRIVLADATVREVLWASLGKWALIALAFALLALLAWGAARRALATRPALLKAAALAALAAAALGAAGTWRQAPQLLSAGMLAGIGALLLLTAWRWRAGPPAAP